MRVVTWLVLAFFAMTCVNYVSNRPETECPGPTLDKTIHHASDVRGMASPDDAVETYVHDGDMLDSDVVTGSDVGVRYRLYTQGQHLRDVVTVRPVPSGEGWLADSRTRCL